MYVHAALVADCSRFLDRMINGHLSEAKQGFALLDDVDQATFVRFIRWTYTKDYPVSAFTWAAPSVGKETPQGLKTEAAQKEALTSDDFFNGWGDDILGSWDGGSKSNKKKKKKISSTLNTRLKETIFSQKNYHSLESLPKPRSNMYPDEDHIEVLLSHAHLYVFAEKYDIQPLKKLSLQKLRRTLANYTLFPERVGDITTLIRYAYANTAETIDETEDIRTMLARYVGI